METRSQEVDRAGGDSGSAATGLWRELASGVRGSGARLDAALRVALAGAGVSVEQWWMLDHLMVAEVAAMSALSRVAQTPPPTTTRLVDRLTELALVYRALDPVDARRVLVRIGPRGVALWRELEPATSAALGEWAGSLEAWQARAVVEILRAQ